MRQYPAIYSAFFNTPHCILPEKASAISSFLELKQAGGSVTPQELSLIVGEPKIPEPFMLDLQGRHILDGSGQPVQFAARGVTSSGGAIAVIPIFGTLTQHGRSMEDSGKTSTADIGKQIKAAANNPEIAAIVLHVDSPGGQAFGTQELSDQIFAARDSKRIVAVIDSTAASAALWIATAASEVSITPGGEGGSVGVVCIHQDVSAAAEQMGVKTTLIATPRKKVAGNPFEPLDEATLAELEAKNQTVFDRFVAALSRNRGVTKKAVQSDFGGGGMLFADEAKAAGMVDRIETFQQAIDRILSGQRAQKSRARMARLDLAQAV